MFPAGGTTWPEAQEKSELGLGEGAKYVVTQGMERYVEQGFKGQRRAASKRNLKEWSLLCPQLPSLRACRSLLSTFSKDDDRGEEWERHEALHEDVTRQERTTERLFEEEIELKWEKGGSGLVFYTDAQFWQEEEGGNAGIQARAGVIPAASMQSSLLHIRILRVEAKYKAGEEAYLDCI